MFHKYVANVNPERSKSTRNHKKRVRKASQQHMFFVPYILAKMSEITFSTKHAPLKSRHPFLVVFSLLAPMLGKPCFAILFATFYPRWPDLIAFLTVRGAAVSRRRRLRLYSRHNIPILCQEQDDVAPASHVRPATAQVLASPTLPEVEDVLPEETMAVSDAMVS